MTTKKIDLTMEDLAAMGTFERLRDSWDMYLMEALDEPKKNPVTEKQIRKNIDDFNDVLKKLPDDSELRWQGHSLVRIWKDYLDANITPEDRAYDKDDDEYREATGDRFYEALRDFEKLIDFLLM